MKEVTIKSNRPHQTRFLPAVMHGETLYGPLFIGFPGETTTESNWPYRERFLPAVMHGEVPHGPLVHRFPKKDGALPMDRAAAPAGITCFLLGAGGSRCGAVVLERRPRMRVRYHGLSHIGSG